MKRIITVALCAISLLSLSPASAKNKSVPASDSRVTWVGRTRVSGGAVSFDWSATYARIAFEGDYIAIRASDTKKNYFNVWIDKPMQAEPDRIVSVEGRERTIVLADKDFFKEIYGKKGPASHTVIIQKRTEGEQGLTTVNEIVVDGDLVQAERLKERQIEFVGDSYTCGYGSENSVSADPYTPETQNSSKTYAAIVSRYFDCDFVTVSHSGQGIVRNYNDAFPETNMTVRYRQTFDEDKNTVWNASKSDFSPAVTVIYLGTNDFSVSKQPSLRAFKDNYLKLLRQIKANYGEDHPVLCVASKCDELLFDYVRDVVHSCGLENVTYYGFFDGVHYDNDTELGASWHPNYAAHKKLAYAIIPYIATMTGWDIEDKIIE